MRTLRHLLLCAASRRATTRFATVLTYLTLSLFLAGPGTLPIQLDIPEGAIHIWQHLGNRLLYRGRYLPHYRDSLPEGFYLDVVTPALRRPGIHRVTAMKRTDTRGGDSGGERGQGEKSSSSVPL